MKPILSFKNNTPFQWLLPWPAISSLFHFLPPSFVLRTRPPYLDAEPFQFAHNSLIAPPRILPREPHNELADLTTDGSSANPVTICPTPRNQPTMPFEQGGRLDDK